MNIDRNYLPIYRIKYKKNVPGIRADTGDTENGGYLLSRLRSTIGDAELNCSVRNGKRWNLRAIAT